MIMTSICLGLFILSAYMFGFYHLISCIKEKEYSLALIMLMIVMIPTTILAFALELYLQCAG